MEASHVSFEPPKDTSSRGMSGMVIPLIFVSVILLGAVLLFGALAFDLNIPGRSNTAGESAAPEDALEASGFTMRERTTDGETTLVDVEVTILNTSELPVGAFQVMVQCTDNGYVSAIQDVSAMDPEASRTVAMELSGRGEPSCLEPVIDFSATAASN
jgi:hypothetical protein